METHIFFLIFLASFIISVNITSSLLNVLLAYITFKNPYVGAMCFSVCCSLNANRLKDLATRIGKYQTLTIAILLKTQKMLNSNEQELSLLQEEIGKLKDYEMSVRPPDTTK